MVGALCLFAALHVLVFAAAFPFFDNVDESSHLATILKFAHGEYPRAFDDYSPEVVRDLAFYDSGFYLGSATNDMEARPPPWRRPAPQQAVWLAARAPQYAGTNYQNSQPPIYYATVAMVWDAGRMLGVDDGHRLYLARFANAPVVALLVLLGWLAARTAFPNAPFRRLAAPAVIAFMPQTAFYSLENDAFSPLFYGLAFLLLLQLAAADQPSAWLGAAAGLALAGAFLVKMTNVPPLIVAAGFFVLWAGRRWRAGKLAGALPCLTAISICAIGPAAAWSIWCRQTFGDFTGTRIKAQFWTWTPKPFSEWWPHPIFTAGGARKFFSLFFSEFWQGEFTWHCQPMVFRAASWLYALGSVALIIIALAYLVRRAAAVPVMERRALWFGFFAFASCVAFLIYTSISFNFNQCPIPNPQFPYLTCGRQALGALIPIMLVLVCGLDQALSRVTLRTRFLVLGLGLAAMLGNEIATDHRAFADRYNWFHL